MIRSRISLVLRRPLSSHAQGGPSLPQGTSVSTLVFLCGTFAGTVGSLVGMGGAFVALPFLTGFFRLKQHVAHGTSIAAVLATSIGGSLAYIQREKDLDKTLSEITIESIPVKIGDVDVLTAACVAISSSIAVIGGAKIAQRLSAAYLKKALGVFMLLVAPTVPLRDHLKSLQPSNKESHEVKYINAKEIEKALSNALGPLTIGVFSGIMAGLFGVGGGAITVPALTMFTDLDYQVSLGTSLAVMLPTAMSGCITHARLGTMKGSIAIPLAAGCLVGSYVGGTFGKHLGDKKLQYGFAGVMAVLGTRTLLQVVRLAPK
ncbi:sulfite exporter TauE/SafE family protein [archaeon]|nr:MAG: sulfite exporter TauE/SafE family protein [archaeon]